MPAALRVRFLRTACPACWLLGVSRLIASRMVFRAQGESPAPRSWKRRATCSRRVVRRVCSELIMWYRKLTILDFECEKREKGPTEPNTPTPPGVVNSHTDPPWMDILPCGSHAAPARRPPEMARPRRRYCARAHGSWRNDRTLLTPFPHFCSPLSPSAPRYSPPPLALFFSLLDRLTD